MPANKNVPNGFTQALNQSADHTARIQMFATAAGDATPLFLGDLVKQVAGADANGVTNVTAITAVADLPLGVVVGIIPDMTNLNLRYKLASSVRYVLVDVNPDTVYEAQASAATGVSALTKNVQPTIAGGNTTTGRSLGQLDSATFAVTATHMFQVVGVANRVDNDITFNNARLLVRFNRQRYNPGTAGI